jgi:hypothetical protein
LDVPPRDKAHRVWNLRVMSPRHAALLGRVLVTLIFIHLLWILLGELILV